MTDTIKLTESDPKEVLKDQLILIASNAFANYGIKTVTMDEIAASAGISKRTLYQLFKDKEALLRECILKGQEKMRDFVAEVLSQTDNVLEVILRCYKYTIQQYHITDKRFFEDIQKYPRVYDLFLKGQRKDSTDTINFFTSGVKQGLFRPDVNFEIVNILVREQFNFLLHSNLYLKFPFLEVYESIMFTYLRGISTPKGIDKLEKFIEEYRIEQKNRSVIK
ncbi:regulatory protein TetR [Bacteroides coprosuis DSM 18011]|uniref:Regulatory protein TetR n=1 Tax=Bacteroides coprosuis DSM 18011 TaxID=679937 RepID=F3ZPZ1_9BACE|nr:MULTISPECIES: TetR/AcrR family transcriptional regulator [Bacteroides]EGJ70433.1 regulatory protein TetR [Bacteroides coprosuis DSM 18011]HJD92354.1 TetR/AcrR family transcriptional regulator [Bacteroides coprosuis]